jgi:hypothetical protein
MIPTWMIERLERARREREAEERRPQLQIELPVSAEIPPAPPRQPRRTVIVIEL